MRVNARKVGIGRVVLCAIVLALVGGIVGGTTNGYATDGGGWIGSGGGNPTGGGSSTSTSGDKCTYYPDKTHVVDCVGVSWIFYKSELTEDDNLESVEFVPHGSSSGDTVTIPDTCSDPNRGGGFWHFGKNIESIMCTEDAFDANVPYFGDYDFANFQSNINDSSLSYLYNSSMKIYPGDRNNYNLADTSVCWRYKTGSDGCNKIGTDKYVCKATCLSDDIKLRVGGGWGEEEKCSLPGVGEWGHDTTWRFDASSGGQSLYRKYYRTKTWPEERDLPLGHVINKKVDGKLKPIYSASRVAERGDGIQWDDTTGKVTGGEVWNAFLVAYGMEYGEVDINDPEQMQAVQSAFMGTYAFCWWPGMEDSAEYHAKSRVFVDGASQPNATADTYVSQTNPAEASTNIYIRPGNLSLSFKHNAYASTSAEGVDWRVERIVDGTALNNESYSSNVNLTTENNNNHLFQNGSNDTPVRASGSEYNNLSFSVGTSKSYAERLTVNPNDSAQSKVTANIYVPYNFINTTSVSIGDTVYAGETATINRQNVTVGVKYNEYVGGSEYATRVDNAKVKLLAYLSNSKSSGAIEGYGSSDSDLCAAIASNTREVCNILKEDNNKTLNANNNFDGVTVDAGLGNGYNVYDAPAGKYYCVALAVYPYTSGSDNNLDSNGDGSWYISAPSCAQIAKRPSLRVLGSGIFSNGSINTPASVKKSLNGIYSYDPTANNSIAFGSWVEQGVIAYGQVAGLASGASTGRISIGSDIVVDGSNERNLAGGYCDKRVPLSFANYGAYSDICGLPGGTMTGYLYAGNGGSSTTDKSALVDYLKTGEPQGEPLTFSQGATVYPDEGDYYTVKLSNGKMVRVTEGSGNLNINVPYGAAIMIEKNITHLVDADNGTVYINSNIVYNNETYSNLGEISKMIIHGDNIIIDCYVTRIDAILISDHSVKTCDGDNIDDNKHANQLLINGQIISDTFEPKRTYGAGVGAASGISAETINYDTSTILWARNMVNTTASSSIVETYRRIVAPRF